MNSVVIFIDDTSLKSVHQAFSMDCGLGKFQA
jgi:hypothetical protein